MKRNVEGRTEEEEAVVTTDDEEKDVEDEEGALFTGSVSAQVVPVQRRSETRAIISAGAHPVPPSRWFCFHLFRINERRPASLLAAN